MAENGPFGTPFLTPQKTPKKFMLMCLLCVLSQEVRHINFFLGAQNGGLGGGQKVYVKRVYVFFLSLTVDRRTTTNQNKLGAFCIGARPI